MLGLHRLLHRHPLEGRVVGDAPEDRALVGPDRRRDAEQDALARVVVLVDDDRDPRRDRVVAHPRVAVVRPLRRAVVGLDPARHPHLDAVAPHVERLHDVRHLAHRAAVDEREVGDVAEVLRRRSEPDRGVQDRAGDPLAQLERRELRRVRQAADRLVEARPDVAPVLDRRVGRDARRGGDALRGLGRERRDVGAVPARAVEPPAVVRAGQHVAVHLALGQVRPAVDAAALQHAWLPAGRCGRRRAARRAASASTGWSRSTARATGNHWWRSATWMSSRERRLMPCDISPPALRCRRRARRR